MNDAEYRRTTLANLLGRRYPLRRDLRTRSGIVARAGTVVRITGKHGGLEVTSDPCECCGVTVRCTHVPPSDLGDELT